MMTRAARILRAITIGAALAPMPAFADQMVCTLGSANEMLDMVQANSGDVPLLKMTIAGGISAMLVGNPKGDFMVIGLRPDGRACVFAIGDGMKVASPNERFPKYESQ